ncbi:MAG: hypothetical protein AAFX87_17475 [Bacteroidota bacterium]
MRTFSTNLVTALLVTLALCCTACQSNDERTLDAYISSINDLDFKAFKEILHPTLTDLYELSDEAEFVKLINENKTVGDVRLSNAEIIDTYVNTTSKGQQYTVLTWRVTEKRSFDKNSSMLAFYRSLQEGYRGQKVDQQTIQVEGEKEISFRNTHISLLTESTDSEPAGFVPICRKSVLRKVFGEEEGEVIYYKYQAYYGKKVEPLL